MFCCTFDAQLILDSNNLIRMQKMCQTLQRQIMLQQLTNKTEKKDISSVSKQPLKPNYMKINFTLTRLLLFCFLAFLWSDLSAHNVNYYTGTCNSGPTYSVQPNVTNVNSNSNYAWQYKNTSGTWVCITNGNNTINGNTYSVTGASINATVSPGPIVFTNPNSALQGLEIRCLISDGAAPCTMPAGNSWTSTTNHFINVNGSPCSTCNNVTDAGLIGSNETICGTSMNPALITNITSPSGGSGTLQYLWLISTDGGATNTTISGATNDTYDPPTITQTTWYRRCSRRSGCTSYDGESNWVMKELSCCSCAGNLVSNNSFENGTINWDYSGGTFTAGNGAVYCGTHSGDFQITNTSSNWVSQEIFPTSYAAGTTLNVSVYAGVHVNTYYQEVFVDYFDANWNYLSNTAVEVNKVLATAPVGPQLYTFTSTIPAGVGHISVGFSGNGNWIKTDNWCVTMGAVCNNVTSAGTIGNDETLCGASINPANIVSLTLPSGGNSNTLEYVWIMTTDPNTIAGSTWNVTTIAGATGSSYDPPVITQTTWYRRCARRAGCIDYAGESNWVKKEVTTCCTATITGLQFKDPTGVNTTVTPIVNGGTYSIAALTSPFNVEALLTGNMESVRFTLTGSASSTNVENTYTWDYAGTGSTWPNGAGTFNMLIEAFSQDNALGSMCASQSFTFTLVDCNNVTSGGTIGNNETICGLSFDPANIVSLTSPSGGTGTLEYVWLVSTDGGTTYTTIPGATNDTYDPGTITQTTWYRRCARRFGCTDFAGESNWVMKELKVPVTANAGVDKNLTCTTSSTTIGTVAVSGSTYVWSPTTNLSSSTIAQPVASPNSTITYTVTVTGSNGCSATDAVVVNVNKTTPVADAGPDKTLTCTTVTTTIGTAAVSGNTYAWSPATGLSSTTIAQPTATPTVTTTYTVTVTGSNGCTATDVVIVNVNKTPPVADAGVDKNLNCTTTSTSIGSATVSGNTYSWSPSTGLSSTTIAQPTANPSGTTTYTVTVTGANGCSASDVVVVNVNTTPPVTDAGTDKVLNCITTSTLIGTAAIAGNTYSWSPATGLSSIIIAQPTATPTVTTTYTVTVTGANGCTATDVVLVTVNKTPPVADAGPDKNLNCTTTSTSIGTTAIAGNTYSWSPSAGLSSASIAQPTASPSVTTTYTVTVTASNGCTSTDAVVVNVNTTLPSADAGIDKTLNCTTTSTTIGSVSVSGNTYSWSPATGLSSTTIAQPTANPTTTTTYTVTVTGANGCTASDVVIVNVNTTVPSANAGPDKNLNCTTTSATIGTTSIAGNTYSWSPSTGLSSTSIAQPTANPSVTTTYTVTVTGANGCTSSDAVVVNVNTTPPTANAGNDQLINCSINSVVLGTTAVSGYTYQWNPFMTLSSNNVAQPTANPNTTTTYTMTVTGSNGCTASDVVVVTVNVTPPTADAGPDKDVCSLNSVMIGTATIAGNSYSWSPASGLSATNIAQPTANPSTTTSYTVTVTGSNGCTSTDVVVLNFKEGSIGNYVWSDINGNGTNDETSSAGINGVSVQLWTPGADNIQGNTDDQLMSSTTTANDGSGNPGYYNFKICTSGNYYIKFPTTTTTSNTLTTQTVTAATDNNSDANTGTGNSPVFAINTTGIGVSKDNNTIDAGYVPLLSLGNTVWVDVNKNGLKDATESGMTGATVNLYADNNSDGVPDGAAIATTTTNATGLYVFNNVYPGNYVVGVIPAAVISGNAYVSSPVNELSPNSNVDNNDNGIQTLAGQTYSGTITLLAGTEPTGETPNNGNSPDANSNLTLDFGFYQPVNIAGNVFNDITGPANVDGTGIGNPGGVQLFANLIDPSGNVVAVVPINPDGTYSFLDVTPNTTYTMILSTTQGIVGSPAPTPSLPLGWSNVSEDCCDNTGNDGTTNGTTTVVVGTTNVTNVNFGIASPMSVGNMIWNDINKDGLKDASEAGIAGATVYLYNDANQDGSPDGAAIANMVTTSTGLYVFNNLTPGNYIVGVVPPTPASGNPYASSPVNELNPNSNVDNNDNGITSIAGQTYSGTITLSTNAEPLGELPNNGTAVDANSNLTLDFGFYQAVNITGNVFVDNNGPTNVDGTGIGSPSGTQVFANLVNAAGNVVAVVAVNANGTYSFLDVTPNTNYTMVLSTTQGTVGSAAPSPNLPSGWINVSEDCCDNTGNDGTTNGITSFSVGLTDVNNVNFGIRQPLSLGNAVWNDANKNGTKDATEIGISGATVKLYNDANLDGNPDGAAIASTITNSNGLYIFNDLYAGNYIVGVTPPAPVTGNEYESSTVGQENNPNLNVDNNDNGIIKVGGETISGTVTLDLGTEPIGETPNNGTASDVNSNLTVDFGFYQPVNISGNVFIDNNGPANVDGTGIGAPGGTQVYANLVNTTTGAVEAVVPVNPNGTYFFADVRPNTTFSMILTTSPAIVGGTAPTPGLPNGWINVSEDCCDNTGNDGTTNGITTVVVGMNDVPNVNFGIREPLSLGNAVWNDINRNGLKESSEPAIVGATVKLYADANLDGAPDGAALSTTTTNSNGLYIFNELFAGNYIVGVTPPTPATGNDFESSVQGEESNPNLNVDNNDNGIIKIGSETISGTVNLSLGVEPTGENPNNGTSSDANSNLTVDFGFYQPVNISGNVYVDNNGPANVDGTGIGAPGGTQLYANLVNASGVIDAVVPVNPNGTYFFADVRPNTMFTMVLSTTAGSVGGTAPTASLPNGWVNVSEDCCDNTGNDGNTNGITTVTVGLSDVPNVNFGIKQPLSVGNLVWLDVNRDGLKDLSESGIAGATVNLYADANSDGVPDGAALLTATTNVDGLYVFNGLDQGNYVIGVVPPTGNVYTSSINGQEINPNLNVDNNDNGIVTVAGETRSGTITLTAGTEPLGETPNNGNAPDANSNLTIDFGFFVCPNGFTFTPQYVCPGQTINLTALEPTNYTGGVWSQGGVTVTNSNVTAGTYLYTFTNGTCTSTGTVTIDVNVPDYTPTITIAPSAITGVSNVRVIINISEILNKPSCSDVYIFVPRLEPRFVFGFEPTSTVIGGVPVNNNHWQYFTSNPNFYVWKYTGAATFPAGGSSKLGFIGSYDPSQTDGATTFSVQIFQGSGGETNITNNTDSENLIYFR